MSLSSHRQQSVGASLNTSSVTTTPIDEEKEFIEDIVGVSNQGRRRTQVVTNVNGKEMPFSNSNNVKPLTFNTHAISGPSFNSMKSYLSILEDDHSIYMAVSKACLFFNQFAGYGSSSSTPPGLQTHLSTLLDMSDYVSNLSSILSALSSASSNHTDRRCRILAINTLSLVSKSALGVLIVSPIFMNNQDISLIMRIQDEICNDAVLNILSCALEDDDGVSSVAFEALGRLVIDIHDNNFHKEVRDIIGLSCPPMFTSCHGLWTGEQNEENFPEEDPELFISRFQDYDAAMYNSELRWRILESTLSPRVRKILNRIQLIKSTESQLRCLPFLNEIVVFVYKHNLLTGMESNCDRDTFAKRWYESDVTTMVDEYVKTILMPLLNKFQNNEGNSSDYAVDIGVGVATNALILCSVAKCQEPWLEQMISLSMDNLERGISQVHGTRCIDQQMTFLSIFLIGLCGVQESKVKRLQYVTKLIQRLPSTLVVPNTAVLSALQLEDGTRRRPTRCGFWTEIAMTFFLPRGNFDIYSGGVTNTDKSASVQDLINFLGIFSNLTMTSRKGQVLDPGEEMIYSFCSVAFAVGKAMAPLASSTINVDRIDDDLCNLETTIYDYKNWIDASIVLLHTFAASLSWKAKSEMKTLEHSSTLLCAAQKSYIELLRLILVSTGTVSNSTSIYSNFYPFPEESNIDENGKVREQKSMLLEAIKTTTIENDLTLLAVRLMEVCTTMKPPQILHLSLLCLLSDAWIQQSRLASEVSRHRELNGPVDVDEDIVNFNETTARNLLSLLGAEISNLIDGEKKRLTYNAEDRARNNNVSSAEALRNLLMCIACVESIAYTAHLSANHFAASESNVEDEESARYIVSVCIVVLKGQGKIECDEDSPGEEVEPNSVTSPPRSPKSKARITAFTSECSDAAKRLRDFVGIQDESTSDFDDPSHRVLVDFNCLCPIFKRTSFEIPFDECDEKLFSKDEWKLADQCSLIESSRAHLRSDVSLAYMLGSRRFFESHYDRAYLLHLYRQQLSLRVNRVLSSSPVQKFHEGSLSHSNDHVNVIQRNFRSKKLLRVCDTTYAMRSGCDVVKQSIHSVTGCSEPISAVLNYSVRRHYNSDGTLEFKLVVTVQLYNVTPVPILNGLQLEMQISPSRTNFRNEPTSLDQRFISATATFQNELHAAQKLIWEVVFDPSDLWSSDMELNLFITLNDIEMEMESAISDTVRLDTNKDEGGQQSIIALDTDSASGSGMLNTENVNEGKLDKMDVEIEGETVFIPHDISLFPCPQVFYSKHSHNHARGYTGDERMFHFLWLSMPQSLSSPIVVHVPQPQDKNEYQNILSAQYPFLSNASHMKISCDGRPIDAWALWTWYGKHLLLLFVPPGEVGTTEQSGRLHVRSDDAILMKSLFPQ